MTSDACLINGGYAPMLTAPATRDCSWPRVMRMRARSTRVRILIIFARALSAAVKAADRAVRATRG